MRLYFGLPFRVCRAPPGRRRHCWGSALLGSWAAPIGSLPVHCARSSLSPLCVLHARLRGVLRVGSHARHSLGGRLARTACFNLLACGNHLCHVLPLRTALGTAALRAASPSRLHTLPSPPRPVAIHSAVSGRSRGSLCVTPTGRCTGGRPSLAPLRGTLWGGHVGLARVCTQKRPMLQCAVLDCCHCTFGRLLALTA